MLHREKKGNILQGELRSPKTCVLQSGLARESEEGGTPETLSHTTALPGTVPKFSFFRIYMFGLNYALSLLSINDKKLSVVWMSADE